MFCGCLDMKHLYDLYRWKFLSGIAVKLPFLSACCAARELQCHLLLMLRERYEYAGNSKLSYGLTLPCLNTLEVGYCMIVVD